MPLGKDLVEDIDTFDARFISRTVCPVAVTEKRKLAKLLVCLVVQVAG